MRASTKKVLSIIQRTHLDYPLIKMANNRFCNNVMLKYCWDARNYRSFLEQYHDWSPRLRSRGISLKGKKVLDIGGGSSLGLGYFFFAEGFESWTGSDFHKSLSNDPRAIEREKRLARAVAEGFSKEAAAQVTFPGQGIAFGPKFAFIQLDAAEFRPELTDSYDIILSSAVLEHVTRASVEQSIRNMASYLRAGGVMFHEIDLRDHVNVSNPFHFLRYEQADWDALTGGTIFYTNRLRASDFLSFFKAAGLTLKHLEVEREALPNDLLPSSDFAKYDPEDLRVTRLFCTLEKPL